MKRLIIILLAITNLISCSKKGENSNTTEATFTIYNFEELKPVLEPKDDATYIVNFWATWCKPCIEELPIFQEIHDRYSSKNVKVILVSLDFPEKIETQLKPFIAEYELTPRVILLNDPHENEWIPKIDPEWSGALPATLIYTKNKRAFYEQSFTKEALLEELKKFTKL